MAKTVNRFGEIYRAAHLTKRTKTVVLDLQANFSVHFQKIRDAAKGDEPMSIDVQEAVKRSIQTEKNAMNFYQLGARQMKDPDAKRTFELLAREEREHAGHFYRIYQGTDIPSLDAFLDVPPDNESSWMASITRVIGGGFTEQKALELAMEREMSLEKTLRETAARMSDPEVRAVYELNATETHNHYLMIESEYARLMGMVHETDIDTYVRE
jgi:rubrerythrin